MNLHPKLRFKEMCQVSSFSNIHNMSDLKNKHAGRHGGALRRQVDLCEAEASLVYIESSRTTRAATLAPKKGGRGVYKMFPLTNLPGPLTVSNETDEVILWQL